MHIKKGMTVRIISGNHKGSEGKVLHIFHESDKVIIEGVNLIKRATRPSQENPAGGFVEKEGPIHISNMLPVHKGNTTREIVTRAASIWRAVIQLDSIAFKP